MSRCKTQHHDVSMFQSALDASTDAIIITHATGEIIYVNPAWERTNGYCLQEVIGKDPRILQSGKTPKAVYRDMWRTLKKGKSFSTEQVVNRRKDGSEYCERITISPVFIKKQLVYYIGLIQDITARKQVEELQRLFITMASHQLKTPLSIIKWYVDILIDGTLGTISKEMKKSLRTIQESADRGIRLITNLLTLSQLERGILSMQVQEINICHTAQQIATEFQRQAHEKNLTITVHVPDAPCTVTIDENFLLEALRNIVNNAILYTEKGSIRINLTRKKNVQYIDVIDTGPGIPKNIHTEIFSTTIREHSSSLGMHGAHIGLYMAREFLRMQGGDVELHTSTKKGTTFRILMPTASSSVKKEHRNITR